MTIKEMKSADLETLLNRMCRLYMSERKWAAEEVGNLKECEVRRSML